MRKLTQLSRTGLLLRAAKPAWRHLTRDVGGAGVLRNPRSPLSVVIDGRLGGVSCAIERLCSIVGDRGGAVD